MIHTLHVRVGIFLSDLKKGGTIFSLLLEYSMKPNWQLSGPQPSYSKKLTALINELILLKATSSLLPV